MDICNHNLTPILKFLVSGPLRFTCTDCGLLIFREHPKAVIPFNVIFTDVKSIILGSIVFTVFPLWFISGIIIFSALLYCWDVSVEPLQALTEEQENIEKIKNKIALVVAIFVLVVIVRVVLQ